MSNGKLPIIQTSLGITPINTGLPDFDIEDSQIVTIGYERYLLDISVTGKEPRRDLVLADPNGKLARVLERNGQMATGKNLSEPLFLKEQSPHCQKPDLSSIGLLSESAEEYLSELEKKPVDAAIFEKALASVIWHDTYAFDGEAKEALFSFIRNNLYIKQGKITHRYWQPTGDEENARAFNFTATDFGWVMQWITFLTKPTLDHFSFKSGFVPIIRSIGADNKYLALLPFGIALVDTTDSTQTRYLEIPLKKATPPRQMPPLEHRHDTAEYLIAEFKHDDKTKAPILDLLASLRHNLTVVATLKENIGNDEPTTDLKSLTILAHMAPPEMHDEFWRILNDVSNYSREYRLLAAQGLAKIDNPRTTHAIIQRIKNDSQFAQEWYVDVCAIGHTISDEDFQDLWGIFAEGNIDDFSVEIVKKIYESNRPDRIKLLTDIATDHWNYGDRLSRMALECLRNVHDESIKDEVIGSLRGWKGEREDFEAVLIFLADYKLSRQDRKLMEDVLQKYGSLFRTDLQLLHLKAMASTVDDEVHNIYEIVKDTTTDEETRYTAFLLLCAHQYQDDGELRALLELYLSQGKFNEKMMAVGALQHFHDDEALQKLSDLLNSREGILTGACINIREAAMKSLSAMGTDAAADVLMNYNGDDVFVTDWSKSAQQSFKNVHLQETTEAEVVLALITTGRLEAIHNALVRIQNGLVMADAEMRRDIMLALSSALEKFEPDEVIAFFDHLMEHNKGNK